MVINLCLSGQLNACEFFIAPTGDDTNAGTQIQSFRTLEADVWKQEMTSRNRIDLERI